MNWRATILSGLVLWALWHGWQQWQHRALHPPDGQLAPAEPQQSDMPEAAALRHGRWTLTPRAHYEIEARILSREDYHFDALADLIPMDLALGWGPMSDNRMLAAFEIDQSARFYTWRPRRALPMSRQDVIGHSANTHVIPQDGHVGAQLKELRVGQVVRLSGLLVDAAREDGLHIATSLTRSDSGAGACEVLLVQNLEVP